MRATSSSGGVWTGVLNGCTHPKKSLRSLIATWIKLGSYAKAKSRSNSAVISWNALKLKKVS